MRVIGGTYGGITNGADIILRSQAQYQLSGTPTINSGGTGYAVNDLIYFPANMVNAGASGQTLKVTSVSGGVITGVSITSNIPVGQGAVPGNPVSGAKIATSGGGSGASFNANYVANGSFYAGTNAEIIGMKSTSTGGSVKVEGFSVNAKIDMNEFVAVPYVMDGSAVLSQAAGLINVYSAYTVPASQCGSMIVAGGTASFTVSMPTLQAGNLYPCSLTVDNNTTTSITVSPGSSGGNFYGPAGNGGAGNLTMVANSQLTFRFGVPGWLVTGSAVAAATCSGTPSASFSTTNGIVTHC